MVRVKQQASRPTGGIYHGLFASPLSTTTLKKIAATENQGNGEESLSGRGLTHFLTEVTDSREAQRNIDAELAALQAEVATMKARCSDLEAELKRWRNGDIVCKRVIDTGVVTTTAVEVQNELDSEPPTTTTRKRPRQEPSLPAARPSQDGRGDDTTPERS